MATGVNIDGTVYYAVQLIVLGTPRPSGRPIDVTRLDGSPLVVLDPGSQAPFVPITLTGEAAGLSQVFYSSEPEGLASCDGGPPTKWSTSQFAEMLGEATAAKSAALVAQSKVDEALAKVLASAQDARDSQLAAVAAAQDARDAAASGGGGTAEIGDFATFEEAYAQIPTTSSALFTLDADTAP